MALTARQTLEKLARTSKTGNKAAAQSYLKKTTSKVAPKQISTPEYSAANPWVPTAEQAKSIEAVRQNAINQLAPKPTAKPGNTSPINVPGVLRTSNNYGLGNPIQGPKLPGGSKVGSLSFSVLPGMGNQMFQMPSTTTSGSTQQAKEMDLRNNGISNKTQQDINRAFELTVNSMGGWGNVGYGATKVATGAISKTQMWEKLLTKAKGAGAVAYKYVKNLFAKGGDDAIASAERALSKSGLVDDVARQSTKVDDFVRQTAPYTDDIVRAGNTTRAINTVSTLGRIVGGITGAAVIGGTGYSAYQGYKGAVGASNGTPSATTAGQLRNAVPSTGSTATTGGTTATGGTPRSATTTTTQEDPGVSPYNSETGSVPVYAGPSGVSAERTVSPSSLAGVSTAGGTAPVGEYDTQARQEAGARAIELQQAQANEGVGTAPIGDEANLAALTKARDRAKELLNAGLDDTTRPEFQAQVQQMLAMGISNLRKIQPVPPVPVVDTPEQVSFLDMIDPVQKLDVQAEMDAYRQQLGMPDLEAKKADFNIQLNAINETYTKLIDEIKANPNMPKSLAARRLTEVFNDQKFALGQVLAEMDSIDDQLESNNKLLDQRMGILGMQQDENEKQYTRIMDKFGMMVDSGAVGGMSDKEMSQWSQATGIPLGAIQNMKKKSLDVKTDWAVEFIEDGQGGVTAVYTDKTNPFNTVAESLGQIGKGFAPKAATTGGGGTLGIALGADGSMDDMDALASLVFGKSGSVAAMKMDQATYAQLKKQDPKKAEQWLYSKVASYLPAKAKDDMRVMGSVVDGSSSLLADIQEYERTNPGVYKAAYNSAAPYLTASRDQKYVELMQRLTATGNEYRNAIFGASLTGNEQSEGLKVVFGKNDDLPTIITKLKGLERLGNDVRQRILMDNAGMIGSSLTPGGPGTIPGATSELQNEQDSIDDAAFNQITGTETGGNTGYWNNLWGSTKSFVGSLFGQ